MTFSHPFNALAKLLACGAGAAIFFAVVLVLRLTPLAPESIDRPGQHPLVLLTYYLSLVLGVIWITWRVVYLPYLMPAGNWLFLRVFRKTRIPWNDCVRLSPLFVGDKTFRWFAVEELPAVPEDQRLDYLYQLAEKSGRLKSPRTTRDLIEDVSRQNRPVQVPQNEESKQSFWRRELSERGIGVITIVCGLVLGYISIIEPLLGAARHAERVSTHIAGAVFTPLFLALGTAHAIFGDKAARNLGLRTVRPTPLGWVFAIVFVGLGILLYLWLKSTLKAYGYA